MTHPVLAQLAATADRPGPVVMGVVNVTPDSFSDGGRWIERDAAVGMLQADVLDVGARQADVGQLAVGQAVQLAAGLADFGPVGEGGAKTRQQARTRRGGKAEGFDCGHDITFVLAALSGRDRRGVNSMPNYIVYCRFFSHGRNRIAAMLAAQTSGRPSPDVMADVSVGRLIFRWIRPIRSKFRAFFPDVRAYFFTEPRQAARS